MTELSVDNLPDLGIKTPEDESKIEAMRQSTVRLVTELEKPDNYNSYREAVIDLFDQFGITPATSNPNLVQRNESMWQQKYNFYQEMKTINPNYTANLIDIEMAGEGAYANIYLSSEVVNTLKGPKRVTKVFPGACSLPYPVRPADPPSNWHFPERNFYKTFEDVIGVDISLKNDPSWPKLPNTIQELSEMYSFYVVEGKYYRVNASEAKTKINEIVSRINTFLSGDPSKSLKP